MSSIDRATRELLTAAERELAGEVIPGVKTVLTGEDAAWTIARMLRGDDLRRRGPSPWDSPSGSRARIALAMGSALAGSRAAAFCSGTDLATCRDQIRSAAARSLPLVVHASLRAERAHGTPLGAGHDALVALADAGAVVLVGRDVQEITDLAVVARRVAETARVPVVVAMDRDETGCSPASVTLPTPAAVRAFAGDPAQGVEPNDPTEAMLFGTLHRRMVRLLDTERPLTLGAVSGPDVWPHAALAGEVFEGGRGARAWHDAAEAWARTSGRSLDRVSVVGASRSKVAVVAVGYLAALADRVLQALGGRTGKSVRVVTLRTLRPLDEMAIVNALAGAERVVVLERSASVDATDGPLTRLLRAVVLRALEHGKGRHAGAASLKEKDRPELRTVRAGLGGAAVRAADLAALFTALAGGEPVPDALGIDVARLDASYPKRRVLAERLRREFPGLADRPGRTGVEGAPGAVPLALVEPRGAALGERLVELLSDAAGGARALVHGAPGGLRGVAIAIGADPVAADDVPRLAVRVDAAWDGDEPGALGTIVARLLADQPTLAERKIVAAYQRTVDDLSPAEREACLERFRTALGGDAAAGVEILSGADTARPAGTAEVPVRAQRSGRHDDTLTSLSRFWDHVGVLYRDGRLDDLSPDPYLGTGALPPLSAALTPAHPAALPALDASRCTGCGDCWTLCPEGALGVVMLTPKELLEQGVEEAKRAGADAGALQMILSKLATGVARATKADPAPACAGEAVRVAFEAMAEKLPEARRDALREAAEAVATALDRLPLVRTGALYDDAEKEEPGAGVLLSILTDPDACTSCGLCTRACSEEAIPLVPVADAAAAHEAWALWSRLPDPAGPVLARASRHDDVGLAAATFASRHASMATASARRDGPGSGEMLTLRLVLGAAESARQPIVAALGREVATLRAALADEVQKLLAGALPTDDLDALAHGLSLSDAHEVGLGEIASRLEHAEREHRVDRDRLAAIVDVARRLADLEWRVMTGADGTGRARTALVVAGEALAVRTARFPDTVFGSPAIVDTSAEAAYTVRGVAHGLGETLLEDVRLMRRARLLLDRPLVEANTASEGLAALAWDDLTDDERRFGTPVVVLADEPSLGEGALGLVETLLAETRPVAIVLLAEAEGDASRDDRELGLLGLAAGRALAIQSSIGAPDHLVRGVRDALVERGPSVVRVHAPSPARHGFAGDAASARAADAIATRVHPLLRYVPGEDEVFGAGIDLEGNPEPLALWVRDDDARHRTPADWAAGERRFSARLRPVPEGATRVAVAEQVGLAPDARAGRTPVVPVGDGERAVDATLVDWCATRRRTWRTLQELAGLVTPFTDQVRDAAERDVSTQHAAEIESLRTEHAHALSEAEARVRNELYGTVRERLALLAARGRALDGSRS